MYDVITVGSATVDAYVKTEFCDVLTGKNKDELIAYPIGTKILIEELILTVGGGGTNTAAALSRLGHKVAFLGKIGTQENSHRIMLELKKEKIDASLVVRTSKSRTGYSIILDSIKHDRTILTFRGSNNNLKFNEIRFKKLNAKCLLFTSMIGTSLKTQEKLASYAKKRNMKLMYVLSPYLAKKGKKHMKNIFKKVDILVLNLEEASILVGKNDAIENMLKKLHRLGPEIVALTDGKKGVYASYNNYLYIGKPHNIKVVETTGAGDAFASSFLSGMIRKNDIEFAMSLGMTNAESVISYHGAKNKLLSYNEALRLMRKRPVKIIKKRL